MRLKATPPPSTVGRGRPRRNGSSLTLDRTEWADEYVTVHHGDSLDWYEKWNAPTVIISDGGYGVLGFDGDTSDHLGLPEWYEPHIKVWSHYATPKTTLWFWNSEIGWASVHPILENYGWRYVNANIWNKGKGHIAGNVNTQRIRRFPVVTEVCVQYVYEARVSGLLLKHWLKNEWQRTGLKLKEANAACEVKDVAVRKYLDQGHLWYFPPPEMFEKLQKYANKHGAEGGKPYFSIDGERPASKEEWNSMRAIFNCPHGFTNVWERPALRGAERVKINGGTKSAHFNQKPLDLMEMIIEASSYQGDVVWEPFGGLFSASVAARRLKRKAFSAEIDPVAFNYGVERLIAEDCQYPLPL